MQIQIHAKELGWAVEYHWEQIFPQEEAGLGGSAPLQYPLGLWLPAPSWEGSGCAQG